MQQTQSAAVSHQYPIMDTPNDLPKSKEITEGLSYLGTIFLSLIGMVVLWIGKKIFGWIGKQLEEKVQRVEDAVSKIEAHASRLEKLERSDTDLIKQHEMIQTEVHQVKEDVVKIKKHLGIE